MEKGNILYAIKILQKDIFRLLVGKENMNGCMINNKKLPTPTQMQIIGYINSHSENEIYQKDLENVLKLRRATVSGVLKTMEKNGLIERKISKLDSRTKVITLNDNTKKIFENNIDKIYKIEEVAISDIAKKDLDVFYNVIEKMQKNLEKIQNINSKT